MSLVTRISPCGCRAVSSFAMPAYDVQQGRIVAAPVTTPQPQRCRHGLTYAETCDGCGRHYTTSPPPAPRVRARHPAGAATDIAGLHIVPKGIDLVEHLVHTTRWLGPRRPEGDRFVVCVTGRPARLCACGNFRLEWPQ